MSGDVVFGRALPARDSSEAAHKKRVLAEIASLPSPKLRLLIEFCHDRLKRIPLDPRDEIGARNLLACAGEELASRGEP